MSNLIFSLNSTLPIFIVIIIGYLLGQKKFLTKEFCSVADKLVFRVGLPAMLFCDMTSIDLTENFNGKFVLFCFGATAISIIVIRIGSAYDARQCTAVQYFCSADSDH